MEKNKHQNQNEKSKYDLTGKNGEEPVSEERKEIDLRTVKITLEFYENIVGSFPIADIKTRCQYLENDLGETNLIPVTDDGNLFINESFTFSLDVNSRKDVDCLISTPAILTLVQSAGSFDANLYEQLRRSEDVKVIKTTKSFESIVSIYEAFTGNKVDPSLSKVVVKKTKAKGSKKEKGKLKEKSSKTSKSSAAKVSKSSSTVKKLNKKAEVSEIFKAKDPASVVYGMCTVDFLPLFYGKSSFTETLTISPMQKLRDERMSTYKTCPKIAVTVSIDKALDFDRLTIMNVTVESVYNLPSIMKPEMDYKVCVMLPMENCPKAPVVISNAKYTNKIEEDPVKCWPGMPKTGTNTNATKYKINTKDDLKNKVNVNINPYLNEKIPRMEFNIMKRNFLLGEGMLALSTQIQTYHKIVFELYMTTKQEKATSLDSSQDITLAKDGGQKSEPTLKRKGKPAPFLHLMAIADVTSLLYPGVTKVHLACPLTTYNEYEALKYAGQDTSYFMPKQKKETKDADVKEPGIKEEKGKKGKKDKSATTKSTKSSKKSKEPPEKDLKTLLPPKPEVVPEPEPSTEVFTEDGKPCFIIVEIELSEPINRKREIEDIKFDLNELLQKKRQDLPKIVLTRCLSKDYYREVLGQIIQDVNEKYHQFSNSESNKDFVKYLQNTGAYQKYLTSITKASTLLITNKFRNDDIDRKNVKVYQNYVGEVFTYLVAEMNDTLNKLVCTGLEPVTLENKPMDISFLYAKEAAQLGLNELADRYFLERICNGDKANCSYWFDYAVYNLEISEDEKAFECIQESLSITPNHAYSLLVFGVLLTNKGQNDDAETCFLNLLIQEPRWLEGWGVLYIFYSKCSKHEGMEMALDMANKYIDDERKHLDYFNEFDDLMWTTKICPSTVFFRTATFLLKMRLYDWAEEALAEEIQKHYGFVNYLLSAIYFYRGFYSHALEHIDEAKAYYGSDYAVSSLSGHCLLALGKYEEAKEEYYNVLHFFGRPDDLHLVYVNCAKILEHLGNDQEARKLMLLACKYSPTPYTWFRAGQLYLQENDLLSAEECFSEANFKDNRNPETWAYLALINLKLNRENEAELCYCQAIKNKLDNIQLLESLYKEFQKLNVNIKY